MSVPKNIKVNLNEATINIRADQRIIGIPMLAGRDGIDGIDGIDGVDGQSSTIAIGNVETLPPGSSAYVQNVGTESNAVLNFGIPRGNAGEGAPSWGDITGTLSDQTDLVNALALKANSADLGDLATQDTVDYQTEVTNKPSLGTMASVNDAPSDSKEYVRKNGAWAESSGGGGGGITSVSWGDINGTLANQTDLQTALDAKADEADLGALATKDTVDYQTEVTNKPSTFPPEAHIHDDRYYTESETDALLDEKAPVIIGPVPVKLSGTYIVVPVGARPIDFKATLQVAQTGAGTPSAANIRPFESADSCIVVKADSYGDIAMTMETRPISLPSAMYGGIVDVLNGTVIITHGHIASYNGETLPGVWYSDRDVYASGTTPTVGAEVVYELETPIEQTCSSYTPTMFSNRDTYLWASHQSTRLSLTNYTVAGAIDIYEQGIVDTKTYIDQKDALKANVADLGDLAYEDDAPSDNAEYVRKNGTWAVSSGGGGTTAPTWGAITGTLSQQTDLQNALDAKANTADLGALADHDTVDYATEVTNKPSAFPPTAHTHDDRYYTEAEVDALLADKADTSDLGDLASLDSIDYTSNKLTNKPTLGAMASQSDAPSDSKEYVRKNGAWAESSGGEGGITSVAWGDVTGTLANQTDLATALNGKQNTLTFDSAPTSASTNPVTSGGVYDAIVAGFRDVYKVTLPSASSSKLTFSAPGITADHVLCVEGHAYYTNKSAVMGELSLTTAANSITITGTLSGTTDIIVTLGIPRTITAS